MPIRLVDNAPLNTDIIAELIASQEDLHRVWPLARFPFDHAQWRNALDSAAGNRSFLVHEADQVVGHAAIKPMDNSGFYTVNYLYLSPSHRSRGLGRKLLARLETIATSQMNASRLELVVRSDNPRAHRCYCKAGFREIRRQDTLIRMAKDL